MSEQVVYSDTFETLYTDWRWLRENPDHWRRVDGGLEIRVEPGLADTVINALLLRRYTCIQTGEGTD